MPKVFISYAHEDIGIAKRIYQDLKRYNIDVWLDTESLLPGDRWKDKIQEAIENAHYFLALLSQKSLTKRGFVQKELKTALEILELIPDSETFVIPIRLEDCEVCHNQLKEHHWVDLFPEDKYNFGLNKLLDVVAPQATLLRTEPQELSQTDAINMIKKHNFFDQWKNETGRFDNQFEAKIIKGDKVVLDYNTSLMWQQSGSIDEINYKKAKKWIVNLNQKGFAGYSDWRLPTLEEAMSLMEPERKNDYLYIDPIFDKQQEWIWTFDLYKGVSGAAWVVGFDIGRCYGYYDVDYDRYYVRAVRSGQSSAQE